MRRTSIIPAPISGKPDGPYRVALACGGTAGHVYPALAAAEAFVRAHGPGSVLFIGTPDGFAARLVPPRGYPYETVHSLPVIGVGPRGRVRATARVAAGVAEARRILRSHGTDLVVGFGGYATASALLAARSLGLRTAIHEANAVAGLANRLLARVVDRVYTGFEPEGWKLPPGRVERTGTPIRDEIARAAGGRERAPDAAPRVLVTGGSQGSAFLNLHAPDLLGRVVARGVRLEVVHQTGDDPEAVRRAYDEAGVEATVSIYLDDMAAAYAWADFAVARSGAGTLSELSAVGVPALLVPLAESAHGHQALNAAAYTEAGAGWLAREDDWDAEAWAERISALLADRDALAEASRRTRLVGVPDAAARLVAACDALVGRSP